MRIEHLASALLILTGTLTFAPKTAQAEDFHVNAPVVAATVFPDGAVLTRQITLDLPEGRHRILLPFRTLDFEQIPNFASSEDFKVLDVALEAALGSEPKTFYSAAQRQALKILEATDAQITVLEDEIAAQRTEIAALQAKMDFFTSIKAPKDGIGSVAGLTEVADLIALNSASIQKAQNTLTQSLRDQEDALDDLKVKRVLDARVLAQLNPPTADTQQLTLSVAILTAQTIGITFPELSEDISWAMRYDVRLAQDQLAIDRNVVVQTTGSPLIDVTLTLSTTSMTQNIEARGPRQRMAAIYRISEAGDTVASLQEPMILQEAAFDDRGVVSVSADGQNVSYSFERPVTVLSDSIVHLALDRLEFEAREFIEAVPRTNDTAFFKASFTNTSQEAILRGPAKVFRNDFLVGTQQLALIPAGKTVDLSFGPMQGIRLTSILDRNQTGDRGILTSSNERIQSMKFEIENLTVTAQDVRVLYGMPFSEQEGLEVETKSTPRPSETDVENRRGVTAWDISVPPGETNTIDLDVTLTWPEGWVLDWTP